MKELLNSTCLGNILGILSLLIGCYSIYLTKKVDQKAQDIQKQLKKAQEKAVIKVNYAKVITDVNNTLHKYISSITRANSVSSRSLQDVLVTIGKLLKFPTVFSPEDTSEIENLYKRQKNLCATHLSDSDISECLDIIIKATNIIEKEEYLI